MRGLIRWGSPQVTKPLLVSTSLLFSTYEAYGMETFKGEERQNPIHKSNRISQDKTMAPSLPEEHHPEDPLSSSLSQLSLSKPSVPQSPDIVNYFALGEKHYHGQGVPQNKKKAAKWFKLVEEQKGEPVQFIPELQYSPGEYRKKHSTR